MNILSQPEGLAILALFGISMVLIVWRGTKAERHLDGFLVADRKLGVVRGSFSIAVSWIWAPAIFICSLQAYTKGLAGIFWFTFPNILCFFIFAPFAVRLRREMPQGYTLPQYIFERFEGNAAVHGAYLVVFFGYQLGAIVINSLAGGTLLHALSGIELNTAIISMTVIALAYSLIGGLKASVLTDVIQMGIVLLIGFVLVPWCLVKTGGMASIKSGLGGVEGLYADMFNPWIAFTMGIPMTISLLAGPFSDQMFTQRAMAVRPEAVTKTFIFGGLLFGVVPIVLSLLGFIGAGMVRAGTLSVSDPQMVGPAVVAALLPRPALLAFCLMAFAGLCSTMDSAFCAVSSLGSIDAYKRYVNPEARPGELLRISRIFMTGTAVIGTAIALLQPKLLWVFLIYGALASSTFFPSILSLYWKKVSAEGAFLGVSLALLFGTPLSFYANVKEDPYLIVVAAVLSVSIGLVTCVLSVLVSNRITLRRRDQQQAILMRA